LADSAVRTIRVAITLGGRGRKAIDQDYATDARPVSLAVLIGRERIEVIALRPGVHRVDAPVLAFAAAVDRTLIEVVAAAWCVHAVEEGARIHRTELVVAAVAVEEARLGGGVGEHARHGE
jgi:hypothetical protein